MNRSSQVHFLRHLILQSTAAVSPNSTLGGGQHISRYDVSNPTNVNVFITQYQTPGIARAVSIYNGLIYVADDTAGMQVINYLSYDTAGNPPSITLSASFLLSPAEAEEGKRVRVTANVNDDVQVRNMEFYIDDVKVATDVNFPFEHHFITPELAGQPTFSLQARASDTGANITWTSNLNVTLTPDTTPLQVVRVAPSQGAILGSMGTNAAFFNEPMDALSITSSVSLKETGPDGLFGTADDIDVPVVPDWREDVSGIFFNPEQALTTVYYQAEVKTNVADLAGNILVSNVTWNFRVYFIANDSDGDGVPDATELLLGLDPNEVETDGDGILDGEEDYDADGLSNI